jgi:hypothetical protein
MAGQLRVDEITDEAGTGAPSFPNKITPASLGTGTPSNANFLRGDGIWEVSPPVIEILDTQIFTASGTWTKPSGVSADDTLIVACIGGGGGGGARRASTGVSNTSAGGGGGGGVGFISIRIGDLSATVDVTVGAGGVGGTQTADNTGQNGGEGGQSLFGSFLRSFGGGGGLPSSSVNENAVTLGGAGGLSIGFIGNSNAGGMKNSSDGRNAIQGTGSTLIDAGLTGGGGAPAISVGVTRTQNNPGGTGRLFGSGGDGGVGTTATDGEIPGGGGGGATGRGITVTSAAGARGEVQCYVVRGRVSAAAFFGVV